MVGEHGQRCRCARCRVRVMIGPLILITIGAIFLGGESKRFGIDKLWPILLIVAGILMLAQRYASGQGHTEK